MEQTINKPQRKLLSCQEQIDLDRLLTMNEEVGPSSIITAYRGSIAHGMYVPSTHPNSIDDIDLMSVCICPIETYIGLKETMSRGTKEYKEGPWDVVSYELKKFMGLLLKGNPNVVSMLYLEDRDYLKLTDFGKRLIQYRDIFISKEIYHSFVGYAIGQSKRMTHLAFEGYMGAKRKSLVQKFGYDTKNAAHLIRLLRMAIEFLDFGTFIVNREHDADELLDIKNGRYTLLEVQEEAKELFEKAAILFEKCDLPDKPNYDRASYLCSGIIEDYHGWSSH